MPDRERWPIEESWPSHVWGMDVDRLGHLGYDSDGNLYWDGKPIEIRRPLSLSWWQKAGVIIVTFSAAVTALAAVFSAVADWKGLAMNDKDSISKTEVPNNGPRYPGPGNPKPEPTFKPSNAPAPKDPKK